MDIVRLSLSNLRFHALSSFFNVIVLALGVAVIVMLLHVSDQVEQRFERDLQGIDLVVGAKGSPIQLILSSVFHLDIPGGNIPLEDAEKLKSNPMIKWIIPVSLGDSYQGFRIVGTTPDYPQHYDGELAEGDYWSKPMQAVLGSEVAHTSGLKVGETFVGSHGLVAGGEEHKEFPYTVTGILRPTGMVVDRLVFTDLASVWQVHEHHHHDEAHEDGHEHLTAPASEERPTPKEITALFIGYKSPLAAAALPRLINKSTTMQSASPAVEIARLIKILGIGGDAVQLFGIVLLGIAAVGFFVTLFNAVSDRLYDIALMRSLGATRRKIFSFVLVEGLTLGVCGTILGMILGHLFAYEAQRWIEESRHMTLNHVGFHPLEFVIVLAALAISAVAAIIPALIAYRVNVIKVLSRSA